MEPLARGQIRFRVLGPDTATDEVSAGVFAHQLTVLVRALRAADKAANGRPIHDYVVASLNTSTPTALLAERPLVRFRGQMISGHSGIDALEDCVEAVTFGEERRALTYFACVNQIAKFSKIGYSEIWTGEARVFRVDTFLTNRARLILNPVAEDKLETLNYMIDMPQRDWYKGVAFGSFDGEVKAADLRGALPQITLIMTAGGAEIDCVCRAENIEEIRAALNKRARIYGRAIYDGKSGLPTRIEVSKITVVSGSRDLTRWKGSFKPFEIDTWEENS
jgi:hypothetical protein